MSVNRILVPLLPKGRVDNVLYRAQMGLREHTLSPLGLRDLLDSLTSEAQEIVFPSHFFEYEHREAALQLLTERGIPFYLQLSPGAELLDYAPSLEQIVKQGILPKIELVMDRAPHSGDWEVLKSLQSIGCSVRYVFCPVREWDAWKAWQGFPREILPELYFYFPAKLNRRDSFLCADEIYLLLVKIREQLPAFPIRVLEHFVKSEPTPKHESLAKTKFRHEPAAELFAKTYSQLGQNRGLRAVLLMVARNVFLKPLVGLLYRVIWLLDDPAAALSNTVEHVILRSLHTVRMTLHFIGHCGRRIAHYGRRCVHYGRRCVHYGRRALHYMRMAIHYIHMGLIFLRHCFRMARLYTWLFFFKAFLFLRSPAALREAAPWFYWPVVHPFAKAYWFVEFQFKKRFLGRSSDVA